MQHATLQVQLRLQVRRAINRVRCGAGGCESGFGLWEVADAAVDTGFEEVHFCEDHFVVEAFELGEEGVD